MHFRIQCGIINIELKKADSKIVLTVEDNGIGLAPGTDIANMKAWDYIWFIQWLSS
jgi:nitrogen fixation/metabolism regulation signal transduction histidine kinase